ncbi:MAG: dipeptidase [Gemmatimonadales bacterium]
MSRAGGVVSIDGGLRREARHLLADMLLINGLDASDFGDVLVDSLTAGRVGACLVSSTRNGVGLMSGATSPHHEYLRERADRIALATTVAEIEGIRKAGKIAIIFGLQVADMLEENLDRLAVLHALGLRSCGLAYNVGNYVGSGCTELDPGPLSRFGVAFVEALQSLRIAVDIGGHCSEATSFDALRHTRGPVVCTHTTARTLRNTPRGMTDELMRAIADRGGVIGIAAFSFFLVPTGRGTVDDFVDHMDYVAKLVGPDHVGLGLDFILGKEYRGPVTDTDMFTAEAYPQAFEDWVYPEGLSDFQGLEGVVAGLLARRYSHESIAAMMGGNWLRVWREIWGA